MFHFCLSCFPISKKKQSKNCTFLNKFTCLYFTKLPQSIIFCTVLQWFFSWSKMFCGKKNKNKNTMRYSCISRRRISSFIEMTFCKLLCWPTLKRKNNWQITWFILIKWLIFCFFFFSRLTILVIFEISPPPTHGHRKMPAEKCLDNFWQFVDKFCGFNTSTNWQVLK